MQTIVITGASSGIGKATARHFADRGWRVAATMRRPDEERELGAVANVTVHRLDVTDETSIVAARDEILDTHGSVDVLLNNAGYGLMGPFEAASTEQIERQFATNVFGIMNVTRAFLPDFRQRGAGTIINVSSVGGLITFPMMSLYHATKWAVEGFSESLAYELGELGITVKLIEPGGVATNFGGSSMDRGSGDEATGYAEVMQRFGANMGELGIGGSSAELIATEIYAAATEADPRLRHPVGADADRFVAARREQGAEAFVADMRSRIFGS